jgi:hypothetical protein
VRVNLIVFWPCRHDEASLQLFQQRIDKFRALFVELYGAENTTVSCVGVRVVPLSDSTQFPMFCRWMHMAWRVRVGGPLQTQDTEDLEAANRTYKRLLKSGNGHNKERDALLALVRGAAVVSSVFVHWLAQLAESPYEQLETSVMRDVARGLEPAERGRPELDGTAYGVGKLSARRAFQECDGISHHHWIGAMREQLGSTDVRNVTLAYAQGLHIGARRVPARRAAHVDCAFIDRVDGAARFTARIGVVAEMYRAGVLMCTAVELWPLQLLDVPEHNVLQGRADESPVVLYLRAPHSCCTVSATCVEVHAHLLALNFG